MSFNLSTFSSDCIWSTGRPLILCGLVLPPNPSTSPDSLYSQYEDRKTGIPILPPVENPVYSLKLSVNSWGPCLLLMTFGSVQYVIVRSTVL